MRFKVLCYAIFIVAEGQAVEELLKEILVELRK
ncbi:hypothetical protein BCM20_003027 [Clostridium beijerinckii]|uniref:Uncharacterized protein n=1 Tax=Clostridium beijerinckii TaxID=1520 RepID=A0AAX0AYP3_CLOBE|nr:hypothetical protein [Clostridium beijerinckii]NOW03787.1 hypothetical protein [Clostridium beijerinckii]NRT87926.1 hypothetical protein [Clostridium beijerinckii]NYC03072.1 hypothetical protein [Clostridium beijerinckii]NYC73356.1 hypothetical protein [Clostridium beijerinckii]